jgi:hypothetical protein
MESLPTSIQEAKKIRSKYYYTGNPCKHNHISKRFTHNGGCYQCVMESNQNWYHKNIKDKDWKKRHIFQNVRNRARRKGIDFNIQFDDIHWADICPVLGIELDYSGKLRWHQVSLDRTDSSKGYVKGNVAVMSMRANSIKQDSTLEELENLIKYLKSIE